ncbi:50S ribosomal protein L25/general stress protein Ctc [Funiculus sociatus GB2-A5]|jgi:large subunit ribosomal protein L25|uniref:Large ribosomal subunit protein bL25 n=1 Tax=Funiculus sociatus GB2-A5 TaxID=2933946 RepID=A0ABV0JMN0_9CYAN|nr:MULTISPECIES: 50S ribosomal protein L25/general stress protein Ctc [unclassified Trichocoleus]MBD1905830.1 50S ribosomal protein L25/general stress protein Ctc [Trichocoleus sp. FACHB-832]MBD2065389.1 50S ribosomal protein L25/general stress protein Ctc [Trichocoleus sp. FACHB-6]
MQVTVECQKRPEGSKPNALRRSGLIPVVLYGHKGTESLSLTMPVKKAEVLLRESSVNNTLIDLNIPEISWSGKTLLKEVQKHPWKNSLYHLSFFAVAAHGDLDIEVPLHFVGEAAGVKQEGGLLDPVLTQLQVRCAPESIPDSIEIDVSNMQVGDALHINELVLPPGVTASGEPDQVIVSVLPPQISTEQTETEEATQSE